MVNGAGGVICEIVAMYNALILMGKSVSFAVLTLQYELSGKMWLFGYFGTWHSAAPQIAPLYGLTCSEINNLECLNEWKASDGVIVLTYWFTNDTEIFGNDVEVFGGIHTVAVQVKDDGIDIYNPYNEATQLMECNNFNEYLERAKGTFIYAYYFHDVTEGISDDENNI